MYYYTIYTLQGITVYYNGEVAVVRYIGGFDVSEGTWLGLELKRPCEQHVLLVSMTTVYIIQVVRMMGQYREKDILPGQ